MMTARIRPRFLPVAALLAALGFAFLVLGLPSRALGAGTTASITPNGPAVDVSMPSQGDVAMLTFDAAAGDRVSVEITDVTVGTSACCSTKVSLLRPDGKTLASLTLGTNGGFLDTTGLPSTGTYTIAVDPQSTNTGGATVRLYAVPTDISASVTPGGTVTVAPSVPGQNARVSFPGAAGQRISLAVSDVTIGTSVCCSTKISVLRPDGKLLSSSTLGTNGGFVDTVALPQDGAYTILVDPQATAFGAATVFVYDVPPDASAGISPGGSPVTVTTSVPGQNARVLFDGVADQRVSIAASDVTVGTSICCSIRLSVLRPDGRTLGSISVGSSGGFLDTVTLPSTGTYTILVDPQGDGTGSATLTLYDVPSDVGATATPGGAPVSVTTSTPGQNAAVTFAGASGETVSLLIGPTCCSVRVTILKPNGAALGSASPIGTTGGFVDTVELPQTGTYTVLLDYQGAATGTVTLTLYDVPADAAAAIVAGGSPATATTTVPGQNGALVFAGTAGQTVSVAVEASCCAVRIAIVKPNGATIVTSSTFGTSGGFLDATVLPVSGTYTLLVDVQGSGVGAVTVRLYDVPGDVAASAVVSGSPVTFTTAVPGQNASVSFSGTVGQNVSIAVSAGCCAVKLTILKPNGAILLAPPTVSSVGGFIDVFTLPTNGTYTIGVDPQGASFGATTLRILDVPADATASIAPDGVPVSVTTTIAGQDASAAFVGTAGERVSLSITPSCCAARVSLLASDGSSLASATSFAGLPGFLEPTTLPSSGTYTIDVDYFGATTGTIGLTLYDVPPDVSGALDYGVAQPISLGTPGQNARLTFEGTAGHEVTLTMSAVTIGNFLSGTTVSIRRPDGAVLASTNVGTAGGFLSAGSLPVNGTYTVVVDPQGANTGSMTLSLDDVPADVSGSIVPGGSAVTVTTGVGQDARLSFDATAGERVSLEITANCCLTQFSILSPSGSQVAPPMALGTGGGFVDALTLPVDGTYVLLIDPQAAASGSVTVRLYDVPADATATAVPGGATATTTTTVPGQNMAVGFSGSSGQRVSVAVGPTCCIVQVSVRTAGGATVVAPTTYSVAGGFIDTFTLPATGDYVVVLDPQGPSVGSVSVTVNDVPADATASATLGGPAVTVTTGVPGQNASVSFAGSAGDGVAVLVGPFNCCSTRVSLLAPGGAVLAGPISFNPDGGRLLARLPSAGTYSLFVDPQGSATGAVHLQLTLDNTAPAPPQLTLTESAPDSAVSGTTLFYRPDGAGGSFTLNATTSDVGTGLAKVTFPGLASGFSPTTAIDDRSSPFSQVYSWTNGATYADTTNSVTAFDNVGNSASADFAVTPDSTPPTTTDNTSALGFAWKNTTQIVVLSPSDGAGSGPAWTFYTSDGSTPTTASSQGTSVTLSAEGIYAVKYFSTDNVGNTEAVKVAGTQIRIDKTSPSSAVLDPLPSVIRNGRTLTGSGADALSGLASVSYVYCAGSSCTPSVPIGSSTTGPSYSVTWSSQPTDGVYRVAARATDAAGNTRDSAPQTVTVDNTAPNTTITSSPANPTNLASASFSFSSTEAGSTFQCRLDGGSFVACTSPQAYGGLATGSHTFEVRATDPVGNTDATPASFTWAIDTTPPDTTITSSPTNPTNATSASFSFTSTEGGSSFQCELDGGGFSPCTTPKTYSGLAAGSHTFAVRATDPAGNVDPTPASFTWSVDTSAPDTTIASTPANPTNSTSASFSFTSTEAGSSFQCELDGGGFSACTTPKNYSGLAAGSHTFRVRATDTAGNTDATPASFTWTIDTTAPNTSITSSPANPTNATSASFSFTSTEGGSTFECALDGAAFSACSSPQAYGGLAPGSHTFEVRATDPVGNTDATPASFTWAIDTTPPDTTITSSPTNPTNATSASFSFASTEPGSTFQCDLDGGGFSTCTTPKNYSGLVAGSHTFRVRATDSAGNVDPTAASFTWTVDTTPADTTITSSPTNPTNSTSASFSFTSTEGGSTFECALDGAAFSACSSPQAYAGLAESGHTFSVRARDAAGNVDSTPATVAWTIDTTPPQTTITATPASPSNATSAAFSFVSSEAGSGFECALDGAAFSACSSPQALSGLAAGSHTFAVRATDAAGNTDATPASFTWDVDTAAPDTTITGTPANPTNLTSATFTFSANEAGSTFACRLDGAAFAPCSTPIVYGGLASGSHTFDVRASDPAGNTDPAPASFTWSVDTSAPDTTITASPGDPTSATSASFSFTSTESGSTFECSLDGASFSACTSPQAYSGLAGGSHTFRARATDAAGNTDATPAVFAWTVDTTPPDTTITSSPANPTNSTSASFSFTSSEAGSSFECALDGAPFSACASPQPYSGLAEGSHTFAVRATDPVGNTDGTPAAAVWIVDVTPPAAPTIESPTDGTTTTNTTVTLAGAGEPGSTVEVFEGATSKGTGFVSAGGTWTRTISSVSDGSHTYTAKATDAAGNVSTISNARTVVVDTTAPNTTLGAGPLGSTAFTTATFSFTATEAGSSFECRLDGTTFAACTSPKTYSGLADGPHTFDVRATDPVGNVDPTPATRTWTVDTVAPAAPAITSPADGSSNTSGTVALVGTAEPNATVEIFDGSVSKGVVSVLAAGTWSRTLSGVADGSHVYTAVATDLAGNDSAASTAVTVLVDATPPQTTISSSPANPTNATSASFSFTSTEGGSTFECSLDGAAFSACTSPESYGGLAEGSHTFAARARDAVGNVDATPASFTWTIDTTAPETTIDAGPADPTSATDATFDFSSDDPAATFECSLDGSSFQACSSPAGYTGLPTGAHAFEVLAVDAAGNVDPTPARYAWSIS